MPTKKPDAIALLKQDHREVEDLFEQFEKAKGDDRKEKLCKQICTELIIHTMIEEEIFSPAFRGKIKDDVLEEENVEKTGCKMMNAEMMNKEPGTETYTEHMTD